VLYKLLSVRLTTPCFKRIGKILAVLERLSCELRRSSNFTPNFARHPYKMTTLCYLYESIYSLEVEVDHEMFGKTWKLEVPPTVPVPISRGMMSQILTYRYRTRANERAPSNVLVVECTCRYL